MAINRRRTAFVYEIVVYIRYSAPAGGSGRIHHVDCADAIAFKQGWFSSACSASCCDSSRVLRWLSCESLLCAQLPNPFHIPGGTIHGSILRFA